MIYVDCFAGNMPALQDNDRTQILTEGNVTEVLTEKNISSSKAIIDIVLIHTDEMI